VWSLKPIIDASLRERNSFATHFKSVRLVLAELPSRIDWTEMPPGSWEASPG
jgi:hypothetical protein